MNLAEIQWHSTVRSQLESSPTRQDASKQGVLFARPSQDYSTDARRLSNWSHVQPCDPLAEADLVVGCEAEAPPNLTTSREIRPTHALIHQPHSQGVLDETGSF